MRPQTIVILGIVALVGAVAGFFIYNISVEDNSRDQAVNVLDLARSERRPPATGGTATDETGETESIKSSSSSSPPTISSTTIPTTTTTTTTTVPTPQPIPEQTAVEEIIIPHEDRGYVADRVFGNRYENLGESHTCAVHLNGTISCWGWGRNGQLGDGKSYRGSKEYPDAPVKVQGVDDATAVTTGRYHTCALHFDTTISCWGAGYLNILGTTSIKNLSTPQKIKNPKESPRVGFIQIDAGDHFTCALHSEGYVICWGWNGRGQLGNGGTSEPILEDSSGEGSTTPEEIFSRVKGIDEATQISAGGFHTCALHRDKTVSCWGWDQHEQAGADSTSVRLLLTPLIIRDTLVSGGHTIRDIASVKAGERHTCAITEEGKVWCWGLYHPTTRHGTAHEVRIEHGGYEALTGAESLHAGYRYNCIQRNGGDVWCWGAVAEEPEDGGQYYDYQYYRGALLVAEAPISRLAAADAIEMGFAHTCALQWDTTIHCWGNNSYGQLAGNGLFDIAALGT